MAFTSKYPFQNQSSEKRSRLERHGGDRHMQKEAKKIVDKKLLKLANDISLY